MIEPTLSDTTLYCLKALLPAHAMSIFVRFEPCHSCRRNGCTEKEIDELLKGSNWTLKRLLRHSKEKTMTDKPTLYPILKEARNDFSQAQV